MEIDTTVTTPLQMDQVFRSTRWLAIFIIPFLVAASAILLIWPADTGRLFAWPIKPPMTAMMLGSAYMGGIYFFGRVTLARQWHTVKIGFLPVTTFAGLLGIATLLHWDKFTQGHISFITWAGLYFVAPFLVFGAWWSNRVVDPQLPEAGDRLIPRALGGLLGVTGVVEVALGLLLFFIPAWMITIWPWTLTPLTARVVGAMLTLPGIVQISMALDPRWSSARVGIESQAFSLVFILISAARAWGDFKPANAGTYLFVGGLSALLVFLAGLYLWMQSQPARTVR
jgi:hypothetical protein